MAAAGGRRARTVCAWRGRLLRSLVPCGTRRAHPAPRDRRLVPPGLGWSAHRRACPRHRHRVGLHRHHHCFGSHASPGGSLGYQCRGLATSARQCLSLRSRKDVLTEARGNVLSETKENVFAEARKGEESEEDCLYDCIVSNPPYIADKERTTMARNVLDYEPPTALFVPDDDPLRFYRAIAELGLRRLRPKGRLCFEINPLYAEALSRLLVSLGYEAVTIREDDYGKQRFATARKQE